MRSCIYDIDIPRGQYLGYTSRNYSQRYTEKIEIGTLVKAIIMDNRKELTTPRINIYISTDTKKFLQEIQDKYFISFSTITNIIFEEFLHNGKKLNNLNDLLFDKNTKKTSIKPRLARFLKCGNLVINNKETKIHTSNLLSNLLFLTATNKIKSYVENYEKFKTNIYNRFKNTDEKFYKYNHFSKNQPRFIKQNREYVKKLLGD